MEPIESSPPKEVVSAAAIAAVMSAWYGAKTLAVAGDALLTSRNLVALILFVFAVAAAVWIAQAKRFVLTPDSLQVARVGWPWASHVYRLAELNSVGVAGARIFGNTIIELRFGSTVHLSVPRYYANSGALFRALFSQLGANVEAKNAA